MKKKYRFACLGLACLLTLSACSAPNSKTKTLIYRLGAEPSILNPLLTKDSASSSVTNFIFNGLLKANENLELVPDLAESYSISPDGKVYTFKLRKNVVWHDGEPFTSEDVLFTFHKLLDPATNTVRRSNYIINGKPAVFSAPDPYTFIATISEPFAPFLVNLSTDIIPKHIYENEDINTSPKNSTPIGTGPFKFKSWQTGQYILLENHPDYFKGTPKLDQVLIKIIPDTSTAFLALKKGEIHMSGLEPNNVEKAKAIPHLSVFSFDDLTYTYMGLNLNKQAFKNNNVRKALNYAINREAIIEKTLNGLGSPAYLPSSPVSWAYPEENSITFYNYNPKKAKQLLKEANYTNKNPLSFTILTSKDSKSRVKTAEILQQFYSQIGIRCDIQLLEWQALIKKITGPQKDFDAVIIGWSLGLDPDGYSIWHSSQYPSGFNFINYNNPTVDTLLDEGRSKTDKQQRKKLYQKLYTIIAEDTPYLFLYYPQSNIAVDKRIVGLSKPGPAGIMLNLEQVDIN